MSRIGKQPIAIPSGVEVSVEGNVLKFKKAESEVSAKFGSKFLEKNRSDEEC